MANEDDDRQDIQNQDQNQDRQDDVGDIGRDLDRQLDDLIQQTGRDDGTSSQDQTQRRDRGQDQTQGRRDARGSNRQDGRDQDQQRQDDDRRQSDGRDQTRSFVPQQPRQYGNLFRSDQTGAILDASGRRIANSGLERRVFERVHNIYRGMETEHAAMRQRLETLDAADSAAKQAGLSLEERALGLRIMAGWKSNKVETLRFLLQQAQNDGTDVSGLVQGGSGLTIADVRGALNEIVTEALKPFQPMIEDRQRFAESQEHEERARQEINEFYQEFPNAQLHAEHIANIMGQFNVPMREAWAEIRVEAAKHGWDLNKGLAEQAQATGRANGRAPTGRGNNQRQLPDFSGRGSVNGAVQTNRRGPANVDDSYDDIIQSVLEDQSSQQQ